MMTKQRRIAEFREMLGVYERAAREAWADYSSAVFTGEGADLKRRDQLLDRFTTFCDTIAIMGRTADALGFNDLYREADAVSDKLAALKYAK